VGFRSSHPDEEAVKDALKALKQNNIDISQLVKYRREHCPQLETSAERETSA
jgi:hypothetical protein